MSGFLHPASPLNAAGQGKEREEELGAGTGTSNAGSWLIVD